MAVAELLSHFQHKLDKIRESLLLRDARHDESCQEMLMVVQDAVREMEITMTVLRKEIRTQQQQMDRVKILKSELETFLEHTEYTSSHMPEHLPQTREISPPENMMVAPVPVLQKNQSEHQQHRPAKAAGGKWTPNIQLLTVEEFQAVPKYMKGRITYKQMCTLVEEFNKALAAKHKILTTPRQKQTLKIKNQIVEYKEQETKNTDGFFFVTDTDLTNFTQIKLDTVGRNSLMILRHCGRIRELREAKVMRYLVSAHELF